MLGGGGDGEGGRVSFLGGRRALSFSGLIPYLRGFSGSFLLG